MQELEVKHESPLSVEMIIGLVRDMRNSLIKDCLHDDTLQSMFAEKYHKPLSTIKLEFLKRDLKELLISPVDLAHYSKLITQIKETNSAAITQKHEILFHQEIDELFAKYNY